MSNRINQNSSSSISKNHSLFSLSTFSDSSAAEGDQQDPEPPSLGNPPLSTSLSPSTFPSPVTSSLPPRKMKTRLLWITLPSVVVPLVIAGIANQWLVQEKFNFRQLQQLEKINLHAREEIIYLLQEATLISQQVAENSQVIAALRADGQQVASSDLAQTPIEKLEQQYSRTKLLQSREPLNEYLRNIAAISTLSELSISEQHGLNVAASATPQDFVQRDEAWWQASRDRNLAIAIPTISQSADRFRIEFSQSVREPGSGEFLGVVRATVPTTQLQHISETLQLTEASQGQTVQLLDVTSMVAVPFLRGEATNPEIALEEPIQQVAAALVQATAQPVDAASLERSLQEQFGWKDLRVTPITSASAQGLMVSFTRGTQRYLLTTIPQSPWVAITSADRAALPTIYWQIGLITGLLAVAGAGVAAVLVSRVTQRFSATLQRLSQAVDRASQGQLQTRELDSLDLGRESLPQEVQTLTQAFHQLIGQMSQSAQSQALTTEKNKLLASLAANPADTPAQVDRLFEAAVTETRYLLQSDRVAIYGFRSDGSSYVIHAATTPQLLEDESTAEALEELHVSTELMQAFQNRETVLISDLAQANLLPVRHHKPDQLQVQALAVPIFQESQLHGLLVVHDYISIHEWQETEINFLRQLAALLGIAVDRMVFAQKRDAEIVQSQLLRDITLQITQSPTSEAVLARLPLTQVRRAIAADRVIVYRFDEHWQGTITAESVAEGFPRALGAQLYDPCFATSYVEKYKRGRVQATANIHQAGLTECHLQQLEPFAVKANLVAPILQGDALLGLLIAHQCSAPRDWLPAEIELFSQVAIHIGFALDRCKLLDQRELAAKQAHRLAEEQRQQKEALQTQLLILIDQVQEAAKGNLTVRAAVGEGEIGSVADFFNVIVESLQAIVTHVKQVALQVSSAVQDDDASVRQLAQLAMGQAEEINTSITSIQQMLSSIQVIADSARQAATVAKDASQTAYASGTAMDNTVENILMLRETIGTTAKKVKRLGESSQQISRAVSLIEKVALQTNILAINAGIEAARAGEEGQGFAVVAEEIGQLAIQAAQATHEITELVQTIQVGTGEVVEAMECSTVQVVEGTHLVEETKQNLGEILQVFHQINQLVQSISTAAKSQDQTFSSITEMLRAIADASERTSDSSHAVSQSLQRTVDIAQTLQASVKPFKV